MDLTGKPPDPDHKVKSTTNSAEGSPAIPPMATIRDDDELLLARIGYKQVLLNPVANQRSLRSVRQTEADPPGIGIATRILQMVYRLLRHLHSRSPGLCPGDVWLAAVCGGPSYSRLVLVDRLLHGDVHR